MILINILMFLALVFFTALAWRSALFYFEIKQTSLAWVMVALSAFNAASAASMIL
jgi:hypothetical protein